MRHQPSFLIVSVLSAAFSGAAFAQAPAADWKAPARWHRSLKKAVPGSLVIDQDGVEFSSAKFNQRWAFVEIHSFDLSAQELTLTSYQNRHWHSPESDASSSHCVSRCRPRSRLSSPRASESRCAMASRSQALRQWRKSRLIIACGPVEATGYFG